MRPNAPYQFLRLLREHPAKVGDDLQPAMARHVNHHGNVGIPASTIRRWHYLGLVRIKSREVEKAPGVPGPPAIEWVSVRLTREGARVFREEGGAT